MRGPSIRQLPGLIFDVEQQLTVSERQTVLIQKGSTRMRYGSYAQRKHVGQL